MSERPVAWEVWDVPSAAGRFDVVGPRIEYDVSADEVLSILRDEISPGDEIIILGFTVDSALDVPGVIEEVRFELEEHTGQPVG